MCLWAGTQKSRWPGAKRRRPKESVSHQTKLDSIATAKICKLYLQGVEIKYLALRFSVSESTVWKVIHRSEAENAQQILDLRRRELGQPLPGGFLESSGKALRRLFPQLAPPRPQDCRKVIQSVKLSARKSKEVS